MLGSISTTCTISVSILHLSLFSCMVHGNLLHPDTGEISHRRNIERRATELEMKRQNMHLTIMDLNNEKKKLQKQAYSLRATLVCTQQVFANVVKELQEEKRRREEVAEEAEVVGKEEEELIVSFSHEISCRSSTPVSLSLCARTLPLFVCLSLE